MKVGDLVKFHPRMQMPGCLGIVVARNGEAFDVQWTDQKSRRHVGFDGAEISTELPEFLEVVSKT